MGRVFSQHRLGQGLSGVVDRSEQETGAGDEAEKVGVHGLLSVT